MKKKTEVRYILSQFGCLFVFRKKSLVRNEENRIRVDDDLSVFLFWMMMRRRKKKKKKERKKKRRRRRKERYLSLKNHESSSSEKMIKKVKKIFLTFFGLT